MINLEIVVVILCIIVVALTIKISLLDIEINGLITKLKILVFIIEEDRNKKSIDSERNDKMIKLEKENNLKSKLEELGYKINDEIEIDDLDYGCHFSAEKNMGRGIYIDIGFIDNIVVTNYVYDQYQIHQNKERLKVLELAIETMKKDLGELKNVED